jgi:hypothetical protein
MFGTYPVGDESSRGKGRGVQIRLSAHLFQSIVQALDILTAPDLKEIAVKNKLDMRIKNMKIFANYLRNDIMKWGWEDIKEQSAGKQDIAEQDTRNQDFRAGFISCIHEYKKDGTTPDYSRGETGYTLGSMLGRDPDGANRRELCANAFGLMMLLTDRNYLEPVQSRDEIVNKITDTVKNLFFDPKLGLYLFTYPIPNTAGARSFFGRMGIIPAGTAENGEYHHAQMFMHCFMQELPSEIDTCYRNFQPMLSVMRDETMCGPFETPTNSYASDKDDPHFGKGMNSGLSGTMDWIVRYFETMAGLRVNLADSSKPDITIDPKLPEAVGQTLNYKRTIHVADKKSKGSYRQIPVEIDIHRKDEACQCPDKVILINGKKADKAVVNSLDGFEALKVEIIYQ